MKILLIEDMSAFGKPIKEFLQKAGHDVTWIIGAERVGRNRIVGILPGYDAAPLNDSWDGESSRLVELDPAGLDCAFVDGGLIGPVNSGTAIVPTLARNGVVCVAISGGGAGNPPLIQAGASLGLPKEHVLLALRSGALIPEEVIENPSAVAARMPSYVELLRTLAQEARARGEKFDYGFNLDDLQ